MTLQAPVVTQRPSVSLISTCYKHSSDLSLDGSLVKMFTLQTCLRCVTTETSTNQTTAPTPPVRTRTKQIEWFLLCVNKDRRRRRGGGARTHTHTRTHTCTHMHTHAYTHTRTHTCRHTRAHTHTHTHTHTHGMRLQRAAPLCWRMSQCVCVCVCVCVCECVCSLNPLPVLQGWTD